MPKAGDYFISQSKKNPEKTHIVSVVKHLVLSSSGVNYNFADGQTASRESVVQEIEIGIDYYVIYQQNGGWVLGKKVEIYNYKGTKYLRTDKDQTAADNLDNLAGD
jgi:hypothetical protein